MTSTCIDMIQFFVSFLLREHNSKIKAYFMKISDLFVPNNHEGNKNNISSLGVCDIETKYDISIFSITIIRQSFPGWCHST